MPTERNRYYAAPPERHSISTIYGWSSGTAINGSTIPLTGAWVSLSTSEDGYLNVNANISSGNVAITGVVSIQNPIGVTGTRNDIASGYATGTFMMVGGRAVEVSGFSPGYGSGSNAMLNIDRSNGALLVENTDINYNFDSVTAFFPQSSTVSNNTPSGVNPTGLTIVTGITLQSNTGRKSWSITNLSTTTPLYIKLGTPPASTGSFNFVLNPASTAGYAGGSYFDSPAQWLGAISISGAGNYISWEL